MSLSELRWVWKYVHSQESSNRFRDSNCRIIDGIAEGQDGYRQITTNERSRTVETLDESQQ